MGTQSKFHVEEPKPMPETLLTVDRFMGAGLCFHLDILTPLRLPYTPLMLVGYSAGSIGLSRDGPSVFEWGKCGMVAGTSP